MYGPAVRCKRFRRSGRCGLALMYPASDWSLLCSGPSWISARVRSHYRIGLNGPFGSPVFARAGKTDPPSHLILSQTSAGKAFGYVIDSSSLRTVPLFVPGGRSFVPTCACRRAARKGPSRLAVALALPLAPALPGHALTAPSTARGSSRSGRSRISLDALEGASLVENRPGDAGELVGKRNRQHVVVQSFLGGLNPRFEAIALPLL